MKKPLSCERGLKNKLRTSYLPERIIFLLELAPCLAETYPAQILNAPRFTTELRSVAGLHRAKSLSQLLIRVKSMELLKLTENIRLLRIITRKKSLCQ